MNKIKSNDKTIFICDDDELLTNFYKRVLEGKDFNVEIFTNGEELINRLNASKAYPSLILLDLLMPVRSGWEVIEYIKNIEDSVEVPIIAITGISMPEKKKQNLLDQCSDVIHKGKFDINDFSDKIDSVLSKKG